MRIGFFSDVHGNWEALFACLQDFEKEGISQLLFLGDAVGYGADPDLAVSKISGICEIMILGNHDAAAIGQLSPDYFNHYAQAAFFYTDKVLSEDSREKMRTWPLSTRWDEFTLVHALPRDPESWGYILSLPEAAECFAHFDTQVCLIGHSHRPILIEQSADGEVLTLKPESMVLRPDCRYIINVGSVGQPRDGIPDACYAIYDTEEHRIMFKRIKYDIATAQEKMRTAQIPDYLVERLSSGK